MALVRKFTSKVQKCPLVSRTTKGNGRLSIQGRVATLENVERAHCPRRPRLQGVRATEQGSTCGESIPGRSVHFRRRRRRITQLCRAPKAPGSTASTSAQVFRVHGCTDVKVECRCLPCDRSWDSCKTQPRFNFSAGHIRGRRSGHLAKHDPNNKEPRSTLDAAGFVHHSD